MSQFVWPPVTASNPSVGGTGITAPTSATEVGFVDGSGNLQPFSGTSTATGPNVTVTNFPAIQPVSGTVTANQGTANTATNGWPVKPTDGTNSQGFLATGEGKVSVTQPIAAGTNIIGKFGIDQTTPGTTNAVSVTNFPGTQPVSGTVTANQGTANTVANAWPVKNTDGTNVAAVKAASTAAVATDPSLVVALSPNSPIPTGSNVIGALTANQSVNNAQVNGVAVSTGSGVNGTGVQRVTIATDQAAVATKSPVNATGTYADITNLTNSAQTFTAPAGAVGFILEALSDNTANVRWKVGAAATTSSGMRLEPGRDSGFVPLAANISVICETSATNQVVTVEWMGP